MLFKVEGLAFEEIECTFWFEISGIVLVLGVKFLRRTLVLGAIIGVMVMLKVFFGAVVGGALASD